MRKALFALILAGSLCSGQNVPAKDRMVIVVSIDGFPAYLLADPKLPVPNLRKLIGEGAAAERMIPVDPTVTWPNHTTMVTGVPPAVHEVLYNGLPVRGASGEPVRVDPWRDKAELVRATTVYDLAHRAGLTTAEIDWVAIQNPGTITWSFAEQPKTSDVIPREMIQAGLVTEDDIAGFSKANITWRDHIWTRAAVHIVEKHRPNLLLYHLLNTDSAHHRYGPRTLGGNSALALADARLGELLQSVDRAGLRDRTTIFVVSDHGFKAVKKNIAPNALLRAQGILRVEGTKSAGDVWVIPEGGTAMVYVTNPAARATLLPKLRELFSNLEGVDRVLGSQEIGALGMPLPEKNQRMADLVLAAKDGYAFSGSTEGEPVVTLAEHSGSHGYLASDPEMHAIFVASGYGIRRGVRLGNVRTLDLAPTIAELLSLPLSGIVGRPIRDALAAAPAAIRISPGVPRITAPQR